MYLSTIIIAAAYVAVGVAAYALSNRIEYTEKISISASSQAVFDSVRHQTVLMKWSAWPEATKSTCRVEGDDGLIGTKLIYLTNGKPTGSQEITDLLQGKSVTLTLTDPSPFGQRPVVRFDVIPTGESSTDVEMKFINVIPRPFNLIVRGAGIASWTRSLHQKDLCGLKQHCETN